MLEVKQPEGGGDFEPIPEGQYTARCFKVIDLGTQTVEYMGETKFMSKIMVTWEILDEPKMNDGRPFAISKTYTASLSEKSHLFKDLVSWRGRAFTKDELLGFDISNLVGAYCQIQVIHNESNGRTFANVNTIMGTKERPKAVNKDVIFDISNPDMEIFEGFSDYLKEKIRASQEWRAREAEGSTNSVIEAKDIDIEKGITLEDLDDGTPPIDPKDIPF